MVTQIFSVSRVLSFVQESSKLKSYHCVRHWFPKSTFPGPVSCSFSGSYKRLDGSGGCVRQQEVTGCEITGYNGNLGELELAC